MRPWCIPIRNAMIDTKPTRADAHSSPDRPRLPTAEFRMSIRIGSEHSPKRSRLLPHRCLPPYAHLPGRTPHPVRDPAGHSFEQESAAVAEPALDAEEFVWGLDLFNHGFYWEAHEAWEPMWRAAGQGDPRRLLLKGLIFLAAAGVKIRQRKPGAAARHASRAAGLFRAVEMQAPELAVAVGLPIGELADRARDIALTAEVAPPLTSGTRRPVYGILLGTDLKPRASSPTLRSPW